MPGSSEFSWSVRLTVTDEVGPLVADAMSREGLVTIAPPWDAVDEANPEEADLQVAQAFQVLSQRYPDLALGLCCWIPHWNWWRTYEFLVPLGFKVPIPPELDAWWEGVVRGRN